MAELKPCPFCGGTAKFFTKVSCSSGVTRGWEFGIFCVKCSVASPKTNYRLEVQLDTDGEVITTIDERLLAIEAWNRRVSDG